ncbi:checkpoint clamp complex protein Rad1 [Marasmius crinis-equi]|uniref:Checkpoint clamp complex protein Rad1 n=1 Tax=Marasmius crinis-equi TaxID=585013 RepID=A0ABR3FP74_9AGAR
MSSPANDEIVPVLKASVHDVRHFTSLLRGVNFTNRATVTVTDRGLLVAVEEARTLLGTAYIFSDVFDEYEYHGESVEEEQDTQQEAYNSAFEIHLNTLIECLNIFGTAGGSGGSGSGKHVQWKQAGAGEEQNSSGDEDAGDGKGKSRKKTAQGGNTSLDLFFTKSERKTSMRMSYLGSGYPLTLLIAEDSSGPTTTCEISTFEAEPQLELPFDVNDMKLKVILKSSWLKEALSEIDPSCDKMTFIGNPSEQNNAQGKERTRSKAKPILRIRATSTHGTTEMDYFNDKDVLETFDYRFAHITRAMRALQTSIKTSLRIDKEGLLSLQFLMPAQGSKRNASSSSNFIEFRCLALDEEIS